VIRFNTFNQWKYYFWR